MKLGPIVRFTKKMTLNKCGPGSGPNYGETAVCPLGREGNKWPKLRFSLNKCPFVPFTWDSSSRNGTKAVKIRSLAPWYFEQANIGRRKLRDICLRSVTQLSPAGSQNCFTFFPARPTREGLEYEEEVFPDVGWSRDRRSIDHVRDSLFFLLAPPLTH